MALMQLIFSITEYATNSTFGFASENSYGFAKNNSLAFAINSTAGFDTTTTAGFDTTTAYYDTTTAGYGTATSGFNATISGYNSTNTTLTTTASIVASIDQGLYLFGLSLFCVALLFSYKCSGRITKYCYKGLRKLPYHECFKKRHYIAIGIVVSIGSYFALPRAFPVVLFYCATLIVHVYFDKTIAY